MKIFSLIKLQFDTHLGKDREGRKDTDTEKVELMGRRLQSYKEIGVREY